MNIKNKISNAKLFEEMKEFASKQDFQSLDELNAKLAELVQTQNNSSIPNFLGLSPHQMHLVLYKPFSLTNDLFHFNCEDNNQLKEISIIKQVMFFMNKLKDAGELKGTQLGNLPKNFVVEFYNLFLSNERYARMPSKEDDLYQLTRLKHLLDLAGLIKKQNKKFSLTKKGQLILANENYIEIYKEIILAWTNRFNWAFNDRFSDLPLIQRSAVFNLHLLNKLGHAWMEDDEFGTHYLNAFPDLVREVTDSYWSPEEEIIRCFPVRFLELFCLPLGLVEKKEEGGRSLDCVKSFRATAFFIKNFKFYY